MKVNNCVFLCTVCTCKCVQIAFFLSSRPAWSHTHTGLRQTALEKYDISNKFNCSALALIIYTFWWHFRREYKQWKGKDRIRTEKRAIYLWQNWEEQEHIIYGELTTSPVNELYGKRWLGRKCRKSNCGIIVLIWCLLCEKEFGVFNFLANNTHWFKDLGWKWPAIKMMLPVWQEIRFQYKQ